ncbi:unnamed protein product [Brassica rapa subsp. narinosa]
MNPLFVNLPYMDAFTLGVIENQLLFPLLFRHELETIQTSKEIPRMHFFLPKLTRYNTTRKQRRWGKILHQLSPTASFHLLFLSKRRLLVLSKGYFRNPLWRQSTHSSLTTLVACII